MGWLLVRLLQEMGQLEDDQTLLLEIRKIFTQLTISSWAQVLLGLNKKLSHSHFSLEVGKSLSFYLAKGSPGLN